MYAVTECCSESRMRSGRHEESWNGPKVKIDILDEGFWSPEVFRRYRVMTSMTERCFRSPGKCSGGFMGQGEGANQPTKGLCAPLTYSHVTRGFG